MTTRILIIDPDISFMVSLKQALEGTGEFRVSVSANGPAAEDSLQRERHDIAVLDFEVPELDVMELIADLRRIQRHTVSIDAGSPISGVSTISQEQAGVIAALKLKKPTPDRQLSLL